MHLNYVVYPADLSIENIGEPPVLIIHGLFGSQVNWRSFAKQLSENYPTIVIDLRNHGRSPHAASHSYLDMVNDIVDFLDQHKLSKIIACGHSMGGKVAMTLALLHPERVARLAVLDIAPVKYQHHPAPFLPALLAIDLHTISSRKQADALLAEFISDTATRLFLLQSLSGTAKQFQWRLNLAVLHEFMEQIRDFPMAEIANQVALPSSIPTIFIYSEKSGYLLAEHTAIIEQLFICYKRVSIRNAGHWLHVEQPQTVLTELKNFLENK